MTSCTSFYIVSIVTAVIKGEFKRVFDISGQ